MIKFRYSWLKSGVAQIFIITWASLCIDTAQAETVRVPLRLSYPLLQNLMRTQLFNQETTAIDVLKDPSGCSEILLSDPSVGAHNQQLRIDSHLTAKLAVKMLDRCIPVLAWEGGARIISAPVIHPDNPRIVNFNVIDSELINSDKQIVTSGPLWEQAKQHLHPLFNRFRLDINPSIAELARSIPAFLPGRRSDQIDEMLNSLHLEKLDISPDGIQSELVFTIARPAQPQPAEKALSATEKQLWQQKWQSMDALLTYTVKHYAAATELKELRLTLLDILLNARYQLQSALTREQPQDPVRHWFITSWSQLVPVLEKIGSSDPKHTPLALLTLVAASDALRVLDQLGADIGLDISVDGLRRMARLINAMPDSDPLQYNESIDPELMQLFGFPEENDRRSKKRLYLWPIGSATAAVERSLNNWVPTVEELGLYLPRIRKLLNETSRKSSESAGLSSQQGAVFRNLVLTTAWQESCWRQFVVKNNKIVPLSSATGDTGIMQINEKVWRGFVDLHKLRWDLAYNVRTGTHILMSYLQRYALKNNEHKHKGGLDNLARATYSAYNGGPAQVARYRLGHANQTLQKIDQSFYNKYRQVKQGQELTVAKCLGGTSKIALSANNPKSIDPAPVSATKPSQSAQAAAIFDATWIRRQVRTHFTLQLGVFSSEQTAKKYIQAQSIPGHYAIFRQHKNRQWFYTVIFGRFPRRPEAESMATHFKQSTPWIRPFQDIVPLIQ